MTELNGTTFLSGANAEFIAELYARYPDAPQWVAPSWRRFFAEMAEDAAAIRAERAGPPWARPLPPIELPETPAPASTVNGAAVQQAAIDSIRALNLIRSYRVRGHLEADLDPLHLEQRRPHNELDYHTYGFTEADLDREIFINNLLGRERATLREIVAILRTTYCGTIGVEYMHIQAPAERAWIQERFEKQTRPVLSAAVKSQILETLTAAETFERFLDRRYT